MTPCMHNTARKSARSRCVFWGLGRWLPWVTFVWLGLVLVEQGSSSDHLPATPVMASPPAALHTMEQRIHGQDGKEMVLVPAGWFTMGSSDSEAEAAYQLSLQYYADAEYAGTERWWFKSEQPPHRVWLNAFYMDKYEVTLGEYQLFLQHTGHRPLPRDVDIYAPTPHHPVVRVSWDDAAAYCQWAAKRLPTEAEWEKAARGEDGRTYPWGNEALSGKRANYCDTQCDSSWKDSQEDDGYAYTAPVGSYVDGHSPYGIADLAGNVAEWAQDWYDAAYYQHSAERNPVNKQAASFRILRGGIWYLWPVHLRTAYRSRHTPGSRLHNVGFRCVMDTLVANP